MKNRLVYIRHILDAADKIASYIANGKAEYNAKTYLQDAVIRQLEIIGEASKHIEEAFRAKHPSVPWKRMTGLRDVLIHDYMGVDPEIVWNVAHDILPEIQKEIRKIAG